MNVALKNINPVWAGLVAVAVAIGAGVLLHSRALASRNQDLAAVNAEVASAVQANARGEELLRELPELREAVRRFARQMPADANLSPLIESVGVDPSVEGAPEREITTQATVAGALVARTPFSLRYRGSFRGTIALLHKLQEGELFARIERIVLERGATDGQNRPLRVQVDFSTFARTSSELEKWAQVQP